MNWLNELYDLYEKNQDLAGEIQTVDRKTRNGIVKTSLVLLPISHTTVTAQITVTIDADGDFITYKVAWRCPSCKKIVFDTSNCKSNTPYTDPFNQNNETEEQEETGEE